MSFQLALVTGASSGLGKALALLLAGKGIPLLLTGRDATRLDEVRQEAAKRTTVSSHLIDLSLREGEKQLLSIIQKETPDLIINCAGAGLYGPAWDHPLDETLEMIELNVRALSAITIEATRLLKEQKRQGTILNISSAAAFFSYPTFAVYSASKGFVKQFSEALDVETSPFGIRVLCACPGQIRTDFRRRAARGLPQKNDHRSMSAEFAANEVWKQIVTGKTTHIFDWRYRLAVFISHLIPKRFVQRMLMKGIETRYSPTQPDC